MIHINGSRRKVLIASIMGITQVMYVKTRMSSNIIIQKIPNTVVHLKVNEAMEDRRSHKEMRSR